MESQSFLSLSNKCSWQGVDWEKRPLGRKDSEGQRQNITDTELGDFSWCVFQTVPSEIRMIDRCKMHVILIGEAEAIENEMLKEDKEFTKTPQCEPITLRRDRKTALRTML